MHCHYVEMNWQRRRRPQQQIHSTIRSSLVAVGRSAAAVGVAAAIADVASVVVVVAAVAVVAAAAAGAGRESWRCLDSGRSRSEESCRWRSLPATTAATIDASWYCSQRCWRCYCC